jgi:hypothetical protein
MDQDPSSSIDWRNSFALKKRDFRVDDDGHLLSYWVPWERKRERALPPLKLSFVNQTFLCLLTTLGWFH